MLKDGFAGCTPAVRRPTYKPQKVRQRFPVGADSISARGGSRRRALSSGRGPGMPGPYRVAIVPGGMTFLRAMRRAACPQAAADVCHSGKVRGSPPHIQTAKGAAVISRRGGFYIRPGCSRRRALSSGRGPGMPGPYRDAGIFSACRKRCAPPLAPSARGLRPQAVGERTVRLSEIFRAMARFSPSAPSGHLPRRGRFFDSLRFFCASRKKIPHRPEQRTMGAKRNKQTAKKAQSKTPKRRRSLLLAGTAPERQTAG